MPSLIFLIVSYLAATYADLLSISPEDFQHSNDIKIATIVHNRPSAVSHTTFTRVHNQHTGSNTQHTQHAPAAHLPIGSTIATAQTNAALQASAAAPIFTTINHLPTIPQTSQPPVQALDHIMSVTTESFARVDTPIVKPLTRTPAHLTFAARPVIYQMLPQIKPVRKISFDEVVPSPRNKENAQEN